MKCHFVNFHIRVVILYMNIWCDRRSPVANSTPAEATAVIPLNALSWSSDSSSVKSPPGVRRIIPPFLLLSNMVILLNFPNVSCFVIIFSAVTLFKSMIPYWKNPYWKRKNFRRFNYRFNNFSAPKNYQFCGLTI